MKKHYLLVGFLFSCIAAASQNSQSLSLSQFNCVLFYQQNSNGFLSFNHCRPISSQADQFYLITWKQCLGICCGLSQAFYPYFNQWSLSQCIQSNKSSQSTKNVIKIIILVSSLIFGIALFVFIVYKIVVKCENKKTVKEQQMNPNVTIDFNVPIWLEGYEEVSQPTLSNIGQEESEECPICLEENPQLLTGCSHLFHVHCLLTWFTKNKNCPLCKSTKITYLKLRCKNCQNKYVFLSVHTAIKNIKKWLQFQNVCGKCNMSPVIRVRASTRDQSLAKFSCSEVFGEPEVVQK